MKVANVTAVYNGEVVEHNDDISDADLSALLQFGDEVVIHEIHDEELVETTKTRAMDGWWEETVVDELSDEFTAAAEAADEDDDPTDKMSEEAANGAEPTPEHVAEVGYNTAAGQAQQIEAQRLFDDAGGE